MSQFSLGHLTSSVNEIPIVHLTDATPLNEDDRAAIAQKSREVIGLFYISNVVMAAL